MIGSDPVARKLSLVVEYAIHATVEDRHISIEVAHSIIIEELEDTELGPSVGEALSDQPDFDVLWREQQIDLFEDEVQLVLLKLEGLYGRVRDTRGVIHNQRVLRAVLAKRVCKDDDTRKVATSGDEGGIRVLLVAGSVHSDVGMLGSFSTQAGIWKDVSICLATARSLANLWTEYKLFTIRVALIIRLASSSSSCDAVDRFAALLAGSVHTIAGGACVLRSFATQFGV
jgi:hypothetical protein